MEYTCRCRCYNCKFDEHDFCAYACDKDLWLDAISKKTNDDLDEERGN